MSITITINTDTVSVAAGSDMVDLMIERHLPTSRKALRSVTESALGVSLPDHDIITMLVMLAAHEAEQRVLARIENDPLWRDLM